MDISTAPSFTEIVYATSPFSEETLFYFHLFVNILIKGVLSVLGVMANVINIIVFYKQGPLSSSPNVILTFLAVTDLSICVQGVWSTFYAIMEVSFSYVTLGWWVPDFYIITTTRPLNFLTQLTCWVTTFMGIERAISVIFPFKVKAIFTPRRSMATLAFLFVSLLIIHAPNLIQFKFFLYKDSQNNASYLGITNNNIFPSLYLRVYYYFSPVVLRFASVFIVVMCNAAIFFKVQSSQRFRKDNSSVAEFTSSSPTPRIDAQSSCGESKGNRSLSKDTKLLRMITVVSTVFVICYLPTVITIIVMRFVFITSVDYHISVEYLVYDILMAFQYFNSCINIVIYFNMSTRYKEELQRLCWNKKA